MEYSQPTTRTLEEIRNTPIALLSDEDITVLAGTGSHAAEIRADLLAERKCAWEKTVQAAIEAANAQKQAEAEAAYAARRNRLTITVAGAEGAGKTALLTIIMDTLASHVLLPCDDVLEVALEPYEAMTRRRVMNSAAEAIEVRLSPVELAACVDTIVNEASTFTDDVLDDSDSAGCELNGRGFGMVSRVDADVVSHDGWDHTITTAVHRLLCEERIPAGTDEVTITISTVR